MIECLHHSYYISSHFSTSLFHSFSPSHLISSHFYDMLRLPRLFTGSTVTVKRRMYSSTDCCLLVRWKKKFIRNKSQKEVRHSISYSRNLSSPWLSFKTYFYHIFSSKFFLSLFPTTYSSSAFHLYFHYLLLNFFILYVFSIIFFFFISLFFIIFS